MPIISSTFDGSDMRVVRSLEKRRPIVLEAVRLKMDQLNTILMMTITTEKLQGQVLNQVSGKLAASVRVIPAVVEGDKVTGGVEAGGGPAFYATIQNYGTTRPYEILPVNKKALAFFGGEGPTPRNKVVLRRIIRGFNQGNRPAPLANFYKKRAFAAFENLGGNVVKKVIHPPIKARNFMESTAEEFQGEFVEGISEAARGGASR
jgi:hypothetical protein